MKGTIQLPASVTSIGDNAFALPSGSTGTIANVAMEANNKDGVKDLKFGKTIFANRSITNLYCLGSFPYATYVGGDQTFSQNNVTNLYFFGDGTYEEGEGDKKVKKQGDGEYGYYYLLKTITKAHSNFKPLSQNLYLPSDDVMNFVKQCTDNKHPDWIPETVNSLTFDQTTDQGTYTMMLNSSAGSLGFELALHKATLKENVKELDLNFKDWNIDIFPTTTNQNGNITQIDSKAFDGNNNLQSITIIPTDSCKIEGNAFQGLPSLRYLDLSDKGITKADNYTLSRIPTNEPDDSVAYQYTKLGDKYQYELSDKTPFGGLPAYTLVFLPTNITIDPNANQTEEAVYKVDGKVHDTWKRPLDENYMLYDGKSWYCNNFGVYDVPELNPSTASEQKYSWYSWSTPNDFRVKTQSTFYRDFKRGVPSSVCLPFAPDKTTYATFYTLKSTDGSSVTLTSVDTPEANTPYFIRPTADTKLTSTKEQTIESSATIKNTTNKYGVMHGVYTGQSMDKVSNAYGVTATDITANGITYPAGTFMKFSSKGYINPFRAYLTVSSANAAKFMRFVLSDTTTAIEQTTLSADKVTPYYNLQGMKTAHPTHGIYIHNGQKVIVR